MVKVLVNTKELTRDEWLKYRNMGLGGSDAGIILGVNKFKTSFQLWLEKTNQIELEEINNDAIYFGNALEDFTAKEFEKRTGMKVRRKNQMLQHEKYPFMLANIDREIVGEKAILEVKTTSAYNAKEWENDEVPAHYLCQVAHYLAVTGYQKAFICCLIGGQKFVWKEIQRDEELINLIISAEENFWLKNVLGLQAPALDGSSAAEQYVKNKFPGSEKGKTVALAADHKNNIEQYLILKQQIKDLETEQKRLENLLKMDLADAESGSIQNYQVNWKNTSRKQFDSKKFLSDYPDFANDDYFKTIAFRKFEIKEAK